MQNYVENSLKGARVKIASIDLKISDSPVSYDCVLGHTNSGIRSLKSNNGRQTAKLKIFKYSSKKKKTDQNKAKKSNILVKSLGKRSVNSSARQISKEFSLIKRYVSKPLQGTIESLPNKEPVKDVK